MIERSRIQNHEEARAGGFDLERSRAQATRAIVVGAYLSARAQARGEAGASGRSPEARLDEAIGLTRAIDLTIVGSQAVALAQVRPATFLGKGKVEEIAALARETEADLVMMDCALSPGQQRNLEKALGAKVIDRTGLILEIFGRRARTREGVLQVELAHLSYQKSRLVRSWTHLERQRGGFGFLGGPGETQMEADRRLLQERIARLEQELEGVKKTRGLHRASRREVPYPVVALVGYTNAGKSTLFNRLAGADALAKDMLFATLDPTLRAVRLPHGAHVILSDTVGFISDLPTQLVSAFRATLEEVIEAELILHVRDIAHDDTDAQSADVEKILGELGIAHAGRDRILEVWNKLDLVDEKARDGLRNAAARRPGDPRPLVVSAATGEGLDALLGAIEDRIGRDNTQFEVRVAPEDGEGLAWLHANVEVMSRRTGRAGVTKLVVRAPPHKVERLKARFPKLALAQT